MLRIRQQEGWAVVTGIMIVSLMIAFGTVMGMQFDGGGSSTMVARMPGDQNVRVMNSPSDGIERRVANALLVYSDAPDGPPARLYSTPQVVPAMPSSEPDLSPALIEQLAQSPEKLVLGGEEREMTIMFSDVRGFTTISESFKSDPQGLTTLMNRFLTPLTNAILDRKGTMVARTGLVFALGFEDVSQDALRRASQGEVVIMTDDKEERVRALVRLDEFGGLYLYVGRFIEPRVLAHRDETHRAAAQYERLEGQRSGFQITFAAIYILVEMLFLASAISIGIHFAAQLADPISRLVGAAGITPQHFFYHVVSVTPDPAETAD